MVLTPQDVTGVILAGGRATRIGGGDKGLRPLGGGVLLDRVVARIHPQVAALAINANGDPQRFARYLLPVVPDPNEERAGPLAGLVAGLRWSRREYPSARHLLSVPSDAPFLPPDLVAGLAASLEDDGVAIAASLGREHPVIGLWPVEIIGRLEQALAAGERAAHRFAREVGAVAVPFPQLQVGSEGTDPFFNVNSGGDLAEAERLLGILQRAEKPLPPVIGVVGWKNAGKTTLACRLISALSERGYRVGAIKHSHHRLDQIDLNLPASDSSRHAAAGAAPSVLVAADGVALDGGVVSRARPTLAAAIALSNRSELIIVEGFKHAGIPKIEVNRRSGSDEPVLADSDLNVVAIATDNPIVHTRVPVFATDDIAGLCELVEGIIRSRQQLEPTER